MSDVGVAAPQRRGRLISMDVEAGADVYSHPTEGHPGPSVRSVQLYEGVPGLAQGDVGGSTHLMIQVFSDLVPCCPAELDEVIAMGDLAQYPSAAGPTRWMVRELASTLTDDSSPSLSIEPAWARIVGKMVQDLRGVTPTLEVVQRARRAQVERIVERFASDNRLSPETLARTMGISRRTLYGVYPEVSEFIRERRIAEAQRILSSEAGAFSSDKAIAQRAGFSSSTQMKRGLHSKGIVVPERTRVRTSR